MPSKFALLLALVLPLAACGDDPSSPPLPAAPSITVDYPLPNSIYPPDLVAPTFLWHDDGPAERWMIRIEGAGEAFEVEVAGGPPPQREIDPEAISPTNEIYQPTPYQASAEAWTPSADVWRRIRTENAGAELQVHIEGVGTPSRGAVTLRISEDPVGAPVFYRDVPLMPAVGERGTVQPLPKNALPLIAWRLRNLDKPESKVVLSRMLSCGNCHSFSNDGQTFGMDIDGPQGDKGTYAIKDISQEMSIQYEDVITWNSYDKKPKGHKTIGFLSRISPDGRYVMTTLNEALYVSNFTNHSYLQVFFPTRGILAYYDRKTKAMRALPGADDPAYVHTNGVWSPDGKWIVFSRATARDPYEPGKPLAARPNDPNETAIQYDLYRVAFNDGKGGVPERIEGASENGMSNTFPKVSPDGKWIVWTRCRNGQLMRPDGRLWIVPFEGGEPREMRCNTENMNSWHAFAPNSRWMVFSSKIHTPYTQMFLTHIDENGVDSPSLLVPNSTAANRAVNIPEFLNGPSDAILKIDVPAVRHHVLFWQASDLLEDGRPEEAVPLLQQALAMEDKFARGHAALGTALGRIGKHQEALVEFEAAVAIDPKIPDVLNNYGFTLDRSGRTEEAVDRFLQAMAVDPNFHQARRNLVLALVKLQRFEDAAAHALEFLKRVPDDDDIRWLAVEQLLRVGRVDLAIPQLEELARRRPDDVKARSILTWQLATHPNAALRNGARAVEVGREAVRLTKREWPQPLDALAAALAEAGKFEEAVKVALEAVERAKDPSLARELRGRIEQYRQKRPWRQ